MKKYIVALLLIVGVMPTAFGSDTLACKMVFYRDNSVYGAALSQKVFVNNEQVVKLRNNTYFEYACNPGTYVVRVNNILESEMLMKLAAGKTYYFRFGYRAGFWTSVPEFILVDSLSAYPAIHNGTMRQLDGSNTPIVRPADRVGLTIAIGGGLVSHNVITMVDGSKSAISYGGGVGFGLKYGHEFNRNFDMSIDLNYATSSLRPPVKNATVSFDRFFVGLTPAVIIPIDGGDAMRVKIGAGPDYYMYSYADVATGNLNYGFNDKWKYDPAFGFHISANFEMNFTDSWSINYGLKYYNVQYKFKSGDNSSPTDSWALKPDGSGIEMAVGVNYHF